MKHFKDKNNQVWAFEADGSQDEFIPADLIPIDQDEADEIVRLAKEAFDNEMRKSAPTKESLLAQMAKIQKQIEALE